MKTVGFFGGSFDPIHVGHINLAMELLEKGPLDEVWFCPAQVSPHKSHTCCLGSAEDRLKMVEIAIAEIPQFSVLDVEVRRSGVSYTVDTIRELKENYSNYNFRLLIGEDCVANFDKWYLVEELVTLAPPLVARRKSNEGFHCNNKNLTDVLNAGQVQTNLMDISSTDIRHRLKQKMYCGHLIPGKVLDYINQNRLYFSIS